MSEAALNDEIKRQDIVNNNHILAAAAAADKALEEKTRMLELSGDDERGHGNDYLFEPSLLLEIKPERFLFKYDKFEASATKQGIDLGDELVLRPLARGDYERGYMPLLAQLTEVGRVSAADFERRFDRMRAALDTYYVCVVEDGASGKLVASLTLVCEQKFIRGAGARGRIEDMVVDAAYRGKRLSKLLLDVQCQLARDLLHCYKLSLECKDHLRAHYEQFGFALEAAQNYLCKRF